MKMVTSKVESKNNGELLFLKLAYNKFVNLFEEIIKDDFWEKDPVYRLMRTKEAFSVYIELIEYKPIKKYLIQDTTPPTTEEIGKETFKFIRNYLSHFPLFNSWNEIWIKQELLNWNKPYQSMDRFLRKFESVNPAKFRFWDSQRKLMTYVSINFPANYSKNEKFYLRDMLTEKDGIRFSMIYMWNVLKTQVINIQPL